MSGRLVVHVVEDDDAARESLKFLLETAGLPVRTYPLAKPFLDALPNIEDGCVITDLRMPEIDGLELVRSLKRRKFTLPVIVITGHGDVPLAVRAIKAGALDFIEKPFDGEVLLGVVRSALSAFGKHLPGESERAEIRTRLPQFRGARRIQHLPPAENGVWLTDGILSFEISQHSYRERGYWPPLESLPWKSGKEKEQPT